MSGCWWFGSCPPGLFGPFGRGPGSRSECGRPPIVARVVFEGRGHRFGPEGPLGATQDTRGHRPVAAVCLEHVVQFLRAAGMIGCVLGGQSVPTACLASTPFKRGVGGGVCVPCVVQGVECGGTERRGGVQGGAPWCAVVRCTGHHPASTPELLRCGLRSRMRRANVRGTPHRHTRGVSAHASDARQSTGSRPTPVS